MQEKEFQLYLGRAKNFFSRLPRDFFFELRPLEAQFCASAAPVPFAERLNGEFQVLQEKQKWGELWDSGWVRLQGTVPQDWDGKPVALKLNFGGEALLFDNAGIPVYSFTNTSVYAHQYRKELYQLTPCAKAGERFDLWVEMAANGLFGDEVNPDAPDQKLTVGVAESLRFGSFNREAWLLQLELEIMLGLLGSRVNGESIYSHSRRDRRSVQILCAINEAINLYADNPANAARARAALAGELNRPAVSSTLQATAVGHAHIDTGWLWPVRETIRKCARTFASQLKLMDEYPDYVFGASQAQHYAFTKQHYPELYAKIKERVAEGRWEIQGGMWVEADCNIISGESMVRQFLHGKNFFMDEFGFDVKNLWLPDVFGYSAAMPQIIKRSGCDYFLTQKISWSQFNKFPYHTFLWRGIDNTEVLTHFPPEDTYNTSLVPDQLTYGENNYNENAVVPEFMSLFGIGDGGGGPKEEYIERGLRLRDLEGSPKVKFDRADRFFERVEAYRGKLPRWVGELYLELHRGTLTSQSRTKRNNRKCEQMLQLTEFVCSCLPGAEYPVKELDYAWKKVLINQFHDIIPGSSIREVYEVTEKEHAEILALCAELLDIACGKLLTKQENAVTVINSLPVNYDMPVRLPDSWENSTVITPGGHEVAVQTEADGSVWALGCFAPDSVTTLEKGEVRSTYARPLDNDLVLENALIRYEFDHAARLIRAFDKETQRDILAPGEVGNDLALYVDVPNMWDAWDIDFFYENESVEHPEGIGASCSAFGIVRQVLNFKLKVGQSMLCQQVILSSNSKRLEFHTEADWRESRRMLRVGFPVSVTATEASFDIQYGTVKRPTHRNTSWDQARFEVAAHRFIDLSDSLCGVALLNDCKYGHKVHGNTLDLNLLRATSYPAPGADRGMQRFSYALLPHTGTLNDSDVRAEAAAFNRAPWIAAGFAAATPPAIPCRQLDGAGVSLEVVKKAEKSDATVIRVVETQGRPSTGTLQFAEHFRELTETNLVEWESKNAIPLDGAPITISLAPFEIRTYLVK